MEGKLNPHHYQITIEKYQEQSTTDLLIVYTIRVTYNDDTTWKVERSFNEFESLHKKFVKLYREVPILPNRSIFSMSDREKQIRMQQLESYLLVGIYNQKCLDMHWIMKSVLFLKFLEIEERVKVYSNPPSVLYHMDNAEFPIVQTVIVKNRSLMIHVTGPKHIEGFMSNVTNKLSWLFLGNTPSTTSSTEARGTVLVLKEDDSETHTYSLKSQIALNDIVSIPKSAYLCQLRPFKLHADCWTRLWKHRMLRPYTRA